MESELIDAFPCAMKLIRKIQCQEKIRTYDRAGDPFLVKNYERMRMQIFSISLFAVISPTALSPQHSQCLYNGDGKASEFWRNLTQANRARHTSAVFFTSKAVSIRRISYSCRRWSWWYTGRNWCFNNYRH